MLTLHAPPAQVASAIAAHLPCRAPRAAHDAYDDIFDQSTDGGRYYGVAGVKFTVHPGGRCDAAVTFRTPPDDEPPACGPDRRDSPANAAVRRRGHAELDRQYARAAGMMARTQVRVEVKVADDTAQSVKASTVLLGN